MHEWKSQNHVKWDCKYHLIFIPKYRRKVLYGKLRAKVGTIMRELCQQKGVELVEGKAMSDHIHLCLSIPPKYSVSHVVGFLKGKKCDTDPSRVARRKTDDRLALLGQGVLCKYHRL
jgi:putative transposase